MKTRNIAINSGLLLGTFLLFFGGIELTLRVTGLQRVKPNPPQIYQRSENPQISYELIPNIRKKAYRQTVTTNSLGFRSPELTEGKPLMVVLGDSIAFGYGVADGETLSSRLQQIFPLWDFLNTAAPGYHLGMQTALYEEKLAELQPEALMLVFHYNDFEAQTGWLDGLGVIRAPGWVPQGPECSPIETGLLGLVPGRCWLDLHSAFYKAVKKVVNMRTAQEILEADEKGEAEKPREETVTEEQFAAYLRQLDSFVAVVPQGMPKVFVLWPDRFLHEESRPKLVAEVQRRGFAVVDLYETFGNRVETLGWDTVHPSAAAVQQAAGAIAELLRLAGIP